MLIRVISRLNSGTLVKYRTIGHREDVNLRIRLKARFGINHRSWGIPKSENVVGKGGSKEHHRRKVRMESDVVIIVDIGSVWN